MNITVVGGGIVGLWVAAIAARAGCVVTLYEQFQIGHARGSSHGDTRIFRSAYWEGKEYVSLARSSRVHWEWLDSQSQQPIFNMVGGYYLGDDSSPLIEGVRSSAETYDLPLSDRDPQRIAPGADSSISACEEELAGVIFADNALAALKRFCSENGVTLREETKFTRNSVAQDTCVYCLGPWFSEGNDLAPFMSCDRVYCHWFSYQQPVPLLQKAFLLQGKDGRILYGMPTSGGQIKVGWHNYPIIPLQPGIAEDSAPEQYINDIKGALQAITGTSMQHVKSQGCYFTNTPDENYIVEQNSARSWSIGGLSGHGFKFAPALASEVVKAVMSGKLAPELEAFSVKRFDNSTTTARTHVADDDILSGATWSI